MLVGCMGFRGPAAKVFFTLWICEDITKHKQIVSRCCIYLFAPMIVGGTLVVFVFVEQQMANNYANRSLPDAGPGHPQFFDCRDRTSGLYPAYLATVLCVVLSPLYAALAPEFGMPCARGRSLEEWNKLAEEQIQKKSGESAVLAAKIDAVWRWTDHFGNGTLERTELVRLANRVGSKEHKEKNEKKYAEVCAALGLDQTSKEVRIDKSIFFDACLQQPEATVLGSADAWNSPCGWFEKLRLELIPKPSCLGEFCFCCGLA